MSTTLPHPFKNRWLITGTLTTETELHIGDGFAGKLSRRNQECGKDHVADTDPLYQTVCTDHDGRAFIPSTSLRGPLRVQVRTFLDAEKHELEAWWTVNGRKKADERAPRPDTPWTNLFGNDDADKGYAQGGALTIYDAFDCQDDSLMPPEPKDPRHLPYWDKKRRTCISTSVAINRRTRTAEDKLLYQTEYVPAGRTFTVEFGGENLEEGEIALLLGLLEALNAETGLIPLRLGAQASNGWGRVKWVLHKVECLPSVEEALKSMTVMPDKAGYDLCFIPSKVAAIPLKLEAPKLLVFEMTLHFPGPLLVRDPLQSLRAKNANEYANGHNQKLAKVPNARSLVDEEKNPFIPAKSIRGALRSRLEMIGRTLGRSLDKLPQVSVQERLDSQKPLDKVRALDSIIQLFGTSGWRSPLECQRFNADKKSQHAEMHHDFVAIDRFTGGAAGSKKFDAMPLIGSLMTGKVILHLDRLQTKDHAEIMHLLALLFRDLVEGDLHFGSGASKGYGHCAEADGLVHEAARTWPLQQWIEENLDFTSDTH